MGSNGESRSFTEAIKDRWRIVKLLAGRAVQSPEFTPAQTDSPERREALRMHLARIGVDPIAAMDQMDRDRLFDEND